LAHELAIKLSFPENQGFWEIPVLFEDEQLIALDKPAGLPLTADPEQPDRPNLMGMLHKGIADLKPWAKSRDLLFLMNAYRLDVEASGALLLAKSKPVLTKLQDFFGNEKPTLSVVVMVAGSPKEDSFSVEAKIAPDPNRPEMMRVDPANGKRSRTNFEVIERFRNWTVLRCYPLTFRPHQVRIHLARARLPVAGDSMYRGKPLLLSRLKHDFYLKPNHTERPLLGAPCIHAAQLNFEHPQTGAPVTVEAPWPKDLLVAVKYLRQYAPG
jgi:23S rRNA pseudouridine955/2504/2580 synthase